MVFFEQEFVNGLEGSDAVVCASVMFPAMLLEEDVQVAVDVSVIDEGSAGIL